MIDLDGSQGEGGGQILRTSLTLSMITGTPFRVTNIRANRAKPGLMRQHLVAVQAAAAICGGEVSRAEVGSQSLEFRPGRIKPGSYNLPIGTAGSSTLVLQTLIPALLYADKPSTVLVSGGTHNPMAPPVQFLQRAYGRVLDLMGAKVDIQLRRYGFYPAGGGEVIATIEPCTQLRQIELLERGKLRKAYAEAVVAGLRAAIAERELLLIAERLGWTGEQLRVIELPRDQGPGNAVLATLDHDTSQKYSQPSVKSAFARRRWPKRQSMKLKTIEVQQPRQANIWPTRITGSTANTSDTPPDRERSHSHPRVPLSDKSHAPWAG